MQPRIIEVKPLPNYQLYLKYETNEERVFNVLPYISGEWFGKLQEEQYFRTVHLNGNTVVWQGGQDIAPHELYELSVSN